MKGVVIFNSVLADILIEEGYKLINKRKDKYNENNFVWIFENSGEIMEFVKNYKKF